MPVSVIKGGVSSKPQASPHPPWGSGKPLWRASAGRAGNAAQPVPSGSARARTSSACGGGWVEGIAFLHLDPAEDPGDKP